MDAPTKQISWKKKNNIKSIYCDKAKWTIDDLPKWTRQTDKTQMERGQKGKVDKNQLDIDKVLHFRKFFKQKGDMLT